jgi:branched-chain amino acid transport system substrate-binding protein
MVLVLAACGSSGGSNGSAAKTSGSGSSAPAPTPKGSPIIVGNIGSYSGPASANYVGSDKVLQAWAKSVNDGGGLNGHPVQVIVKDDAGDPAQSLALVKELVEQDHVVAIVAASAADASWPDYVQSQGVAVINGQPGAANFTDKNTSLFLIGSSIPSYASGAAQVATDASRSHFGLVYCAEVPGCAQLKAVYAPALTARGIDFAFDSAAAASDPDYTAVCLAAQQKKVDVLEVTTVQAVWPRIAQSCQSQGYQPLFIFPGAGDITPVLGDSSLNGSVVFNPTFPGFVDDPATTPYQDAVANYLPGETVTKLGGAGTAAWLSAKLFEAATKNLPSDFKAKDVFTGLYSLHDETLGGLAAAPLNFKAGVGSAGLNCIYAFRIENQKITAPNGLRATCPGS